MNDRERARAWRGPWWWRLRCRVAQALLDAGGRLDPDDRSIICWQDDREVFYATVRMPPYPRPDHVWEIDGHRWRVLMTRRPGQLGGPYGPAEAHLRRCDDELGAKRIVPVDRLRDEGRLVERRA